MLRKIHLIIRLTAYICSLIGFVVLMYARHSGEGSPDIVGELGAVFVIVGFVAFLVSYALFMYSKVIN